MEKFSGRFSRLETGIPSSTRSLPPLLLGIPALRNAHIIQFPFTFQFRFGSTSRVREAAQKILWLLTLLLFL